MECILLRKPCHSRSEQGIDERVPIVLLTLGAAIKPNSLGNYFVAMLPRPSGMSKAGTNLLGKIIADRISLNALDMDSNIKATHAILKVGLPQ